MKVRKASVKKKSSLGRTTPDDSVFQHGLNPFQYKTSPAFIDSFNKEESGRSCSFDVNVIRKFENTNERSAELNIINQEDKIRKSSIVLNGPDDSNDMDSARHNPLISSTALSIPKDTTNINMNNNLWTKL